MKGGGGGGDFVNARTLSPTKQSIFFPESFTLPPPKKKMLNGLPLTKVEEGCAAGPERYGIKFKIKQDFNQKLLNILIHMYIYINNFK